MKRYYHDIRVGIAYIIDSKHSDKCNCVCSYPDVAVIAKTHGKYINGKWNIAWYKLLYIKAYTVWLNFWTQGDNK